MAKQTQNRNLPMRTPSSPRRHCHTGVVLFIVTCAVLLLGGCGGNSATEPTSNAKFTTQADLTEKIQLSYIKGRPEQPKTVGLAEGAIVYLSIQSSVKGVVVVEGYNLQKKVVAGEPSNLVVSADYKGSFRVYLLTHQGERLLATLRIS